MSRWHSLMKRDDSELTAHLEIASGVTTLILSVIEYGQFTIVEGELKDAPIEEKTCEVNRPLRYHECEHHAVFLIWR